MKTHADVREELYKGSDTAYVAYTLPSGWSGMSVWDNFSQWVIWFIEPDTEVGGANLIPVLPVLHTENQEHSYPDFNVRIKGIN